MPQEIDDLIKKIEDILANMETEKAEAHYNTACKVVALANYALFLAIVLKSFELGGNIPVAAKISVVFFFFGIISSTLRFIADYLGDVTANLDGYEELSAICDAHGEQLKEQEPDLYIKIKTISSSVVWASNRFDNKVTGFICQIVYAFMSWASLLLSAALLGVGLFFLGISAL